MVLHFLVGVSEFLVAEEYLKQHWKSACNTGKYQLVILFGRAIRLKVSVIFLRGPGYFLPKKSSLRSFSQEWKKDD